MKKRRFTQLSEAEQSFLVSWAKNKKTQGGLMDAEKVAVEAIEHFNRFGWPKGSVTNKGAEARAKLQLLKLKAKFI